MQKSSAMTGWRTVASMIFFLLVCAVVLAGIFFLLKATITTIFRIQSPVASVIVAGLLTLLTSLLVNAWNRHAENKREEKARLREAKRNVYEHLLGVFFDVLWKSKNQGTDINNGSFVDQETVNEMLGIIVRELVIWGSDDMIRLWGDWRRRAISSESPLEALETLAGLMLTMRRELGHAKTSISPIDLLRLFINDIDSSPELGSVMSSGKN